MMRSLFFIIFVLIPLISFPQFNRLKTIEVSEEVLSATVDRAGDLYITTVSGQFQKYDKQGAIQVVYKNIQTPDLFDPRDGARLFAFYRQKRQYAYLSPSFDFLDTFKIDSAFVIEPWLVCPSGDFNVWTLDATDGAIKKINTRSGRIEVDEKITLYKASNLLYLREYQGFLFALTKKSDILIFNSLGKSIMTIPAPGISYFNFLGEELYYLQNDRLKFFDLFSAEKREIKLPYPSRYALLTDERLYLIQGKTIGLFQTKP